jgi:glycosyltransferase involved in cell wall biosynthesis
VPANSEGVASNQQLVNCIMPTRDRRHFVGQAIRCFLRQDYPFKELIIVDDGEDAIGDLIPEDNRIRYVRLNQPLSLGGKRNLACQLSQGHFIAHWDDDDWMAPHRLRVQVAQLNATGAMACEARELLHYSPTAGQAWLYRYPVSERSWVAGCTLLYLRSAWESHPFPEANIGEDSAFIWQFPSSQVRPISDRALYVAIIHSGNTSAKSLNGPCWEKRPLDEVSRLLWPDRGFYAWLRNGRPSQQVETWRLRESCSSASIGVASSCPRGSGKAPLVSCAMPTHNRRRFVPQAISYFLRQDYPNKELTVVDDGTDPVAELVPRGRGIQYIRLSTRHSIGVKRNLAAEAARGEILLTWDDDDWYAPDRISYQVRPLLEGRAEVTGMGNTLMLSLSTGEFWACTPYLYDHMFFQGIHGGTLTFWRELWQQGARFANASLAEEVAVQQALQRRGARLEKLPNQGAFIYVRHDANAWKFKAGEFLDQNGWRLVEPPSFMPEEDLAFYGVSRREIPSGQGSIMHPALLHG